MIHSQDLHKYLQKYQDIERKFFMIARTDIFNINFYKKERFHGSYKGMHYRIEKYAPKEGDTVLRVTVWLDRIILIPHRMNRKHLPVIHLLMMV